LNQEVVRNKDEKGRNVTRKSKGRERESDPIHSDPVLFGNSRNSRCTEERKREKREEDL